MATNLEDEIERFFDDELDEYLRLTGLGKDSADEESRRQDPASNGPSRAGQRQASGQRQTPGRRQAPARKAAAQRPAAVESEPKPAAPPEPVAPPEPAAALEPAASPEPVAAPQPNRSHRHPISKKRRRRRMIIFLALLLVICAGFILAKTTVARVKGFQVMYAATDRQVLSWEESGGADSYAIYDGDGNLLAEVAAGGGAQYSVDGLEDGTQYTYTISAVKNFLGRHTGKQTACSAYTLPGVVSSVSAINSGTGALLSWQAGGASGYEVQYTDSSAQTKTLEANKSDAGGLSIPDLQEGTQYTFQIRSFVQDGEQRVYSDWSSAEPITATHAADMTGIDINKPMVALTFDDGPDYLDYTERILDILKEYGGHASFFQTGASSSDNPEKIVRIVEEGHEIACHTYDHSHYGTDVTAEDIIKADDLIEQACGQRPSAFRSPGGMTTDLIREVCVAENMPIFYWSIDTEDWKSRDADSVCDIVMNNVSDGDIILMHNVYESTVEAVERIVPFLADQGYQLVTVGQLVQAKTGKPPVPGTQYVTATSTN